MSVPIVFDEWVFEDLSGKNGGRKQQETFNLFVALFHICDKVVILEDSPFIEKWRHFYERAQSDLKRRAMSRYLESTIFTNKHKVYPIASSDIKPLADDIKKLVPPSDHYLIQAYLKVRQKNAFLVTTDKKWDHKKLAKKHFDIRLRDPFIKDYIARQNLGVG